MSVVLLRVGIDTGAGGMSGPLSSDGSFEFVPIPEGRLKETDDDRTYGNTIGRLGRALIDFFPERRRAHMRDQVMHLDPEFETFTYGDPTTPKRGLGRLTVGDLLVFYAGLQGWGGHSSPAALYLVAYFVVSHVGFAPQFSADDVDRLFGANAHVRDRRVFEDQYDRLLLIKGGAGSRLLRTAIPISAISTNRVGQALKVLSPAMRDVFGDFGGHNSIQRSPPRWVQPAFVDRATSFVLSLP